MRPGSGENTARTVVTAACTVPNRIAASVTKSINVIAYSLTVISHSCTALAGAASWRRT